MDGTARLAWEDGMMYLEMNYGHTGLYMGAWTLAEAVAYAIVFAVEGLGLPLTVVTVAFLARVVPVRFQTEDALMAGMNRE